MDLGQIEAFALAEDRAQVLAQLIPGTPDYYYYHCLHHEHLGDYARVRELLELWTDRHGHDARVHEIKNRQALLAWDDDREVALARIQDQLRVQFDHQREVEGRTTSYPTRLDFDGLMRTFRSGAMHYDDLHRFTDDALGALVHADDLNADKRRRLLSRLSRPDYGQRLVELILADLEHHHSSGFGSLSIHELLLLEQLEELATRRPKLLLEPAFVQVWLVRLQPSPNSGWQRSTQEREAYLDRLWAFVQGLAPSFNSLKAHVLYHRLEHDRGRGIFNEGRLRAYLLLPREVSYANPHHLKPSRLAGHLANLSEGVGTLFDPPRDDEPLVRDLLGRLLVSSDGYAGLDAFVRKDYLCRLRAEVKILAGVGDMEACYSDLNDPSAYQRLKERVDIEFAPTNRTWYRGDDPVTLEVDVKNVQTLAVKVFSVNTFNYYLANGDQVDTTLDLDGLVASEEHTYTYDEPPLRRVRRAFSFEVLSEPGVYVVELIGNGKSSRALIRKGALRSISRVGAAGQVFTILDEDNRLVPEATLHVGGREYTADDDGCIVVPFSTSPRAEQALLRRGDLTAIETFRHEAEVYEFDAGIYVDRESLLRGAMAQVVVRPLLRLGGQPVSLELIEEPRLVIASVDRQGTTSSQEVAGFELFEDRESVHSFQVPEDLASVSITLRGEVKQLSTGQTVEVSASRDYSLNEIDSGDRVQAFHMARTQDGYVVYLLGKTGEVRADAPVTLTFSHRDYKDSYNVVLQTDVDGRIELGRLPRILSVSATLPSGDVSSDWPLTQDACRLPGALQGVVGETLRVPCMDRDPSLARSRFSLLERRGAGFLADRFDCLSLSGGYLELSGLPAGEFDLELKEPDQRIQISLTAGEQVRGWAVSSTQLLERGHPAPLHIPKVEVEEGEEVRVHVAGATRGARVHVFGTRFYPAHWAYADLGPLGPPRLQTASVVAEESHYVSGRDIGDEYRYILERKLAKTFPGVMLRRPGVLLNPWARRETDTGLDVAGAGGAYDRMSAPPRCQSMIGAMGDLADVASGGDFPNLDFLAQPARVCVNLSPDAQGLVRIPWDALAGISQLRVVAIDALHTVWREVGLTEDRKAHKDLRLRLGLDPERRFTEQKQITVLPMDEALVLEDITTSKIECYDTLARVHGLFSTLSGEENLSKFSFVLRWPRLSREEKCSLYSEHACHELSLFVSQKDPEFFGEVVQPYLRNKPHKTFLDHYLLEDDLCSYLKPWAYGRLNVVERILLGRRIAQERPRVARHVADLHDLLPLDVERQNHLFRTALAGSALEADDALGFGQAAERERQVLAARTSMHAPPAKAKRERRRSPKRSKKGAAPPPPAPSPMPASAPSPLSDPFMEMGAEGAPELEDDWDSKADLFGAAGGADPFGAAGGADPFGAAARSDLGRDLERREQVRQLYRKLDPTQEFAENDYYQLLPSQQGPDLVTVNGFWRDFAAHGEGDFLSRNVAEASRSFTEMMCALSVLDLPFDAQPPETKYDGARLELTARRPSVIFHKEIKPAEPSAEQVPILVSQNYFRADDRYRHECGERFDKYVRDELLVHVVYLCQVVLTNPTSSRQKLDLLLQLPRGAMPVSSGFRTRGVHVRLESYATESIEYAFYFPEPGCFLHFPVHVARDEALIAYAPATPLDVVLRPSTVDETSWPWISQNGEPEQVLQYLRDHNLDRLDLEKIAWRMREPALFEQTLSLLEERHVYSHVLWSYGLLHKSSSAVREYLLHQEGFLDASGLSIESPLVSFEPVTRGRHEHLEYHPLVNARAHRLGAKLKILNDRFREQYQRTLRLFSYRPQLTADDMQATAYYLFLQDRVEEGLTAFAKVDPDAVQARLQLDYMAAYAALARGDIEAARAAANPHRDHPVDRWRKLFKAVLSQIDEALGARARVVDDDDVAQAQAELASTEPALEFSIEKGQVTLRHQNLGACQVNYYAMDIELLFSRQPFVQQESSQFSFIAPNRSDQVALSEARGELTFDLPEEYRSANVIVELVSGGVRQAQAHYAHVLTVQVIEGYGQVCVTHQESGAPLPGVYVKVYGRLRGGASRFYKDGYTDLRGRFEYTSLSTSDLDQVDRLALLVLSEEHGAVIREAAPPKQ